MSTSFYLACPKCRKSYLVGQDGWKFFTFYSGEPQCMAGIGKFLGDHILCDGGSYVMVLPESLVYDFEIVEWPSEETK